jgi:hypothetical protein
MTEFLEPDIRAFSEFTTITLLPVSKSFATRDESLPAIWFVAST